ncbi:MAG: hypothetical protein M1820_009682 [Bogoriella megaspora]|nr:MAG: hypothetical protein M1820_009682 [Bogoriella megaspora]
MRFKQYQKSLRRGKDNQRQLGLRRSSNGMLCLDWRYCRQQSATQRTIHPDQPLGESHLRRLPEEILQNIFEFVHPPPKQWDFSRKPIIKLMRVCKQWHRLAEPMLYAVIRPWRFGWVGIKNERKPSRNLKKYQERSQHVRFVIIDIDVSFVAPAPSEMTVLELSKCVAQCMYTKDLTLRLRGISRPKDGKDPLASLAHAIQHLSRVEDLMLSSSTYAETILNNCNFPRLRNLTISQSGWSNDSDVQTFLRRFETNPFLCDQRHDSIRSLTIVDHNIFSPHVDWYPWIRHIVRWPANLFKLYVGDSHYSLSQFQAFLDSQSHSLQEVTLPYNWRHSGITVFRHMQELRRLTISACNFFDETPETAFCKLQAPKLVLLVLYFSIPDEQCCNTRQYENSDVEWMRQFAECCTEQRCRNGSEGYNLESIECSFVLGYSLSDGLEDYNDGQCTPWPWDAFYQTAEIFKEHGINFTFNEPGCSKDIWDATNAARQEATGLHEFVKLQARLRREQLRKKHEAKWDDARILNRESLEEEMHLLFGFA